MSYQVIIPQPVQKQLSVFPKLFQSRIITAIQLLAENPRPKGAKKLKGYENTYRIRVNDYRVIYEIKDQELIILLLSCSHRKDAY
jgi:mRNA interferase RelE/StbE